MADSPAAWLSIPQPLSQVCCSCPPSCAAQGQVPAPKYRLPACRQRGCKCQQKWLLSGSAAAALLQDAGSFFPHFKSAEAWCAWVVTAPSPPGTAGVTGEEILLQTAHPPPQCVQGSAAERGGPAAWGEWLEQEAKVPISALPCVTSKWGRLAWGQPMSPAVL